MVLENSFSYMSDETFCSLMDEWPRELSTLLNGSNLFSTYLADKFIKGTIAIRLNLCEE